VSWRTCSVLSLAFMVLFSATLLQSQEGAAVRALEEGAENPAVAKLLQKGGKILLEAVASWGVGRSLDKAFPNDNDQKRAIEGLKSQLELTRNDLNSQLREARQSNLALGADLHAVTEALRATQGQLDVVAHLEKPVGTQADVSSLRREINATQVEAGALLNYRPTAFGELHQNFNALQSHLTTQQLSSALLLPPSFNCGKAGSDVERFVCGNPLLSDADGRMGKAYWSLYAQLDLYVSRSQALSLKQSQRQWIRERDLQLRNECMQGSQMNPSCALNIWRARTGYLAQKQSLLGATR
jgi:uncharacterized protein YecT (DUF1311 family)